MCLACVLLFSVVGCRNEQKIVYASMNIANGGFEEGLNDYWKVTATDNAVWTDLDTFHDGSICYHLRKGTHYLSRHDWNLYIDVLVDELK